MAENKIKVLMIEDNLIDQKAFLRFLKTGDYNIECSFASSLKEGCNQLETHQFDAVLVDYQLGDGTAIDLLRTCKRHPIIVITGMGNEEIAIRAMKMGAFDYLIKDVQSNYLKIIPMTLENAIQRWHDQQLQKLLYQTVQSISEAVFVTDRNDIVIFVNPAFQRMYGFENAAICGQSSSVIWMDQRDNSQSLESVLYRINIEWSGRVWHVRADGENFPVMVSRSPVKDDHGEAFAVVGISRDVTEQAAVEAERERLLADIHSTLERFRDMNLALPVSPDFGSLQDIRAYWNHVATFLLDSEQSIEPAKKKDDMNQTGRKKSGETQE